MFASLSTRFRNLPRLGRFASIVVPVIVALALMVGLAGKNLPGLKNVVGADKAMAGPLDTSGNEIIDATGHRVTLTGVNWFGFETGTFAPHGLWTRNWQSMLDQMVASGFNTIRLPYSNELFQQTAPPTEGIDYGKNPDLK